MSIVEKAPALFARVSRVLDGGTLDKMKNMQATRITGGVGSEAPDKGGRPGNYALDSPQSRAAARALLERRFAGRKRIDIVSSIPRHGGDGGIHIGTWTEGTNGSLIRFSNLPPGMTIAEAERIVAQPGWKPSAPPAKPERIRPPLKPEC